MNRVSSSRRIPIRLESKATIHSRKFRAQTRSGMSPSGLTPVASLRLSLAEPLQPVKILACGTINSTFGGSLFWSRSSSQVQDAWISSMKQRFESFTGRHPSLCDLRMARPSSLGFEPLFSTARFDGGSPVNQTKAEGEPPSVQTRTASGDFTLVCREGWGRPKCVIVV